MTTGKGSEVNPKCRRETLIKLILGNLVMSTKRRRNP